MPTLIERNFAGGELAPSLYSRCDISKYQSGLRTLRNLFVLRQGGAANRPGTSFVRPAVDSTHKVRALPFIFSNDQATVIELGHNYINPIFAYDVSVDGLIINSISRANPALVTVSQPSLIPANGTKIYIGDSSTFVGMRQLTNSYYIVANRNVGAGTFTLQDVFGAAINSTSFDTFISGFYFPAQVLTTTYTEDEIFDIRYVQSADVITLTHPNHPPAELKRASGGNFGTWSISNITFNPAISAPTGLGSSLRSGTKYYYVVTAIDQTSKEESLGSTPLAVGTTQTADPAFLAASQTSANAGDLTLKSPLVFGQPCAMTLTSAGNESGTIFTFTGQDKNGDPLVEAIAGPNTTTITTVNSFSKVTKISTSTGIAFATSAGLSESVSAFPNTFSWNAVTNSVSYNTYRGNDASGPFGFIGNSITAVGGQFTFVDVGTAPDYTKTPAAATTDFQSANNYPTACGYYQQSLMLANTNNNPEKVWKSRTGNLHNFTQSSPVQDDDSINFTLVGKQLNAVRHLADLGTLIPFTQSGEWNVRGDASGAITPTTINAKQQSYNGCNNLSPIVIDGSALYVQGRGSIVRDFNFLFQVDGYRGDDLTIFSAHLFDGFNLLDWAYQKVPHSIVWAVRSDGILLSLTYIKEQQILGWAHHDLEGAAVESVTSIPGNGEDLLYMIVNRNSKRSIEMMNTRLINENSIGDSIFLDSASTYDGTNTTTMTMTLSGGSTWKYDELLTLTSSGFGFFSDASEVGTQIWLTSSDGVLIRFTITAFISHTVVSGYAHKTVPATLRGIATAVWGSATSTLKGLDRLEGKNVSVFADGFVIASPHNSAYDLITVTNGSITLPTPHVKVQVGIPITADIETLDVDSANGETLSDKRKLITRVNVRMESSRGLFVGTEPPSGSDYLEGLMEYKGRFNENYDEPVSLKTDVVSVNVQGDWNNNGRVFIRQVDPLPLTINAIAPAEVLLNGGG